MEYRANLPTRPKRIERLPLDRNGYPVPHFVEWIEGEPDFRVMDSDKFRLAVKLRQCWVCGQPLGAICAYTIGPMCAVNRTSAEPPSHTDCAIYSATACPFLANPRKRRREGHLPEARHTAGTMIARNPGVALVWVTRKIHPYRAPGGVLFNIGEPIETLWFAEGRPAMRAEVLASIESGLPLLRAEAEPEGPAVLRALEQMTTVAMALVPA